MKKGHLEKTDSCSKREELSRGTRVTSHVNPQFIEKIQVEKDLKYPSEEQGMVFSSGMAEGKGRGHGGLKIIECLGLEGTLKDHLGSIPAAMGRDASQTPTIASSY